MPRPIRVMVVDDTDHVRAMLTSMLTLDGFEVVRLAVLASPSLAALRSGELNRASASRQSRLGLRPVLLMAGSRRGAFGASCGRRQKLARRVRWAGTKEHYRPITRNWMIEAA